ncbi:helix-turn-helix transcriptional regulator [Glycomyces artemisiae]|uniref:Putative DNA-binding transcriptional regulator YafY n=1 Tax=Glycomyces artemisiae TaxID=1076443 RepID=A0A2T0UPT5_9ACTN|nr:WYL domain-containing protein [Glycomyces artemisiae]PRY59914.1 putative DNA-binding transcriptional regulator YafY [Glycomyces artemisiae]
MSLRTQRLLEMLLLLREHGRLSSPDLAARLGVTTNTVLRDVRFLVRSGVPLATERGRYGGITLAPEYRTSVAGMADDETGALLALATGERAGDGIGDVLGSAVRKAMAALPAPHRDAMELIDRRIIIDPVRWRREDEPAGGLDALKEAVFTDRRLQLHYWRGEGGLHADVIDPYGLVDKAGVWYLVADAEGGPRLFAADRIVGARVLDEPARRRAGVELDALWRELRDRIDEVAAEVRIRRDALGRFVHRHLADLAAPPPEGGFPANDDDPDWVRVRLRFRSVAVARRLLDFGTDVQVLSPPELREDLASTAAEVARMYAAA